MEFHILDEQAIVEVIGNPQNNFAVQIATKESSLETKKSNFAITARRHSSSKRKISFVWDYFEALDGNKAQCRCLVCQACVGNKISNLARHLTASHDITRQSCGKDTILGRSRSSRSFIWKYCSKQSQKHVRCHLCHKDLYFGGGNTANITKHLKRMHGGVIKEQRDSIDMDDETIQATTLIQNENEEQPCNEQINNNVLERKERRGASYVWNYCEKLSRHTIRCKLCKKIMSFHGTANVITHLQRRHSVIGDAPGQTMQNHLDTSNSVDGRDLFESDDPTIAKCIKTINTPVSVVWKYCTRISQDQVRCCFCNKNLSYQGTSNLQRHLHRMHGVVTHGRIKLPPTASNDFLQMREENVDFIWQFSTMSEDGIKIKCNLCGVTFEGKDIEPVAKHLTMDHSVNLSHSNGIDEKCSIGKIKKSNRSTTSISSDDGVAEEECNNYKWAGHMDKQMFNLSENIIKKDDSIYDDIIEEDQDELNYEEELFDNNIFQEDRLPDNARSGNSSPSNTAHDPYQQKETLTSTSMSPSIHDLDSNNLLKLQENRLRMETEYFREKAEYYRMQKYLTALQAKKVRIEIERLNQREDTPVTSATVNGSYTVDVDHLPMQ